MNSKYCNNCGCLSITEEQQDILRKAYRLGGIRLPIMYDEHRCTRFGARLVHNHEHPKILRCTKCLEFAKGLANKYEVRSSIDGSIVENCFVLRPDTDKVAVTALKTYACLTTDKALSTDLMEWILALENKEADGE